MDQQLVTRIVEAALLAANQPLSVVQLHALLSNSELPLDEQAPEGSVETALADLQAACAERGVELVELASGWRFQVQADVHPWVARLWTERQTKYTRATLETLALIAYRQPITRGEIEQVRGVAVSSNIIQALEEREWIRVVGHRDVPGRPALFGTTRGFLDYFGLKRLDELPPLSELKDIGELEPQLPLDPENAPAAAGAALDAGAGLADAAANGDATLDAGNGQAAGDAAPATGDIDTDIDAEAGSDAAPATDIEGHTGAGDDASPTPPEADEATDASTSTTEDSQATDDTDGRSRTHD